MTSRQRYPRGIKGQEALEHAVPPPSAQSPSGSRGDAHTAHSCCFPSLAPGPLTPQPKLVPGGGAPTHSVNLAGLHIARLAWNGAFRGAGQAIVSGSPSLSWPHKEGAMEASLARGLQAV